MQSSYQCLYDTFRNTLLCYWKWPGCLIPLWITSESEESFRCSWYYWHWKEFSLWMSLLLSLWQFTGVCKKIFIWELAQIKARQASFPVMLRSREVLDAATRHEVWERYWSLHLKWGMSGMNHWCAVPHCFSQLGMWGDERYSAINRVKTTDVSLPRRESRTLKKRIKGFPSVLFFSMLVATLAPFLVLCWAH